MTPEAAQFIHGFYLRLRKRRKEQRDLFQVTVRQLESLIRLSSARARAELREEITKEVTGSQYNFFISHLKRNMLIHYGLL